ncbi:hypothetical protein Leryth_026223 [Lithospermum erythrorhizon]|nr:hypothetical protein Leryth_026223 [Lithospermum erythrorhizon]
MQVEQIKGLMVHAPATPSGSGDNHLSSGLQGKPHLFDSWLRFGGPSWGQLFQLLWLVKLSELRKGMHRSRG